MAGWERHVHHPRVLKHFTNQVMGRGEKDVKPERIIISYRQKGWEKVKQG